MLTNLPRATEVFFSMTLKHLETLRCVAFEVVFLLRPILETGVGDELVGGECAAIGAA